MFFFAKSEEQTAKAMPVRVDSSTAFKNASCPLRPRLPRRSHSPPRPSHVNGRAARAPRRTPPPSPGCLGLVPRSSDRRGLYSRPCHSRGRPCLPSGWWCCLRWRRRRKGEGACASTGCSASGTRSRIPATSFCPCPRTSRTPRGTSPTDRPSSAAPPADTPTAGTCSTSLVTSQPSPFSLLPSPVLLSARSSYSSVSLGCYLVLLPTV
jgi:hypothetical protein